MNVGIIGATGYAGVELVRLLLNHSKVTIKAVSSVSYEGKKLQDIYPNVREIIDIECTSADEVIELCDLVFVALPHGLSEPIALECIKKQKGCIDLGADFRLDSEEEYKTWYEKDYEVKEIHKDAVYGLPELYREKIKKAAIVANPGCYPTGAALGLIPALTKPLVDTDSIIIDAKSGTTGAGRGLSLITHFAECNENLLPYKIGSHRHIPEIEQTLSAVNGEKLTVTFTPHLLPVNRGILSTMYCKLTNKVDLQEIYQLYKAYYENEKFVRVLPLGQGANIKNVTYSNYCDISLHMDERTQRLIVVTAIDNMIKGAAGQAIQNMNIQMGWKEDEGLTLIPPAF